MIQRIDVLRGERDTVYPALLKTQLLRDGLKRLAPDHIVKEEAEMTGMGLSTKIQKTAVERIVELEREIAIFAQRLFVIDTELENEVAILTGKKLTLEQIGEAVQKDSKGNVISDVLHDMSENRQEMLDDLLRAFIAQTGCDPKDAELVTEYIPTGVKMYFRLRENPQSA